MDENRRHQLITHKSYYAAAEGYIEGVLSGDIVAGKHVKLAVERHIRDLDRQSTEEFPYYFDRDRAEDVCRFFPMVLRHSVGEWDGLPFELLPFEAFIFGVSFGWKRDSDDTRRFRKMYISMGRKNGKTTICAGGELLLVIGDGEPCAQVFTGATRRDQAMIMHNEVERMVRKSPALSKFTVVRQCNIAFPGTNSFIRPVGSDKAYDGLNPHGVFFDELHAWAPHHRPFYDTMTTGSASRRQPMQVTITTAGDDHSYLWIETENYVKSVVGNEFVDDTLFGFVASIDDEDDPMDESIWEKANPALGVSVKLSYLQDQAREARSSPDALRKFTRYHCNRRVSSTTRAIDDDQWYACGTGLSDWKDAVAISAGIDIGGVNDLAAYGLCAKFYMGEDEEDKPIYRYEWKVKSFVALDGTLDVTRMPYAGWIQDGQLSRVKYVLDDLQTSLIEDCQTYGVQLVAFDPYNAYQIGENLEREGLTPVKMPQNPTQFDGPISELFRLLLTKRLAYNPSDTLLTWCAMNAMLATNRQNRKMYDKANSKDKIDPIVACTMALRMATTAPERVSGKLYL